MGTSSPFYVMFSKGDNFSDFLFALLAVKAGNFHLLMLLMTVDPKDL